MALGVKCAGVVHPSRHYHFIWGGAQPNSSHPTKAMSQAHVHLPNISFMDCLEVFPQPHVVPHTNSWQIFPIKPLIVFVKKFALSPVNLTSCKYILQNRDANVEMEALEAVFMNGAEHDAMVS